MRELKQYLNRRLTGRETAAIIVALAILAGLGWLANQVIAARVFEARVNAAFPKVCAVIRGRRGELVKAIEAYKAHFGVYPPDHVLSRQPLVVDPVTNTLLYELVGVTYNPTNALLQVGGLEPADAKYVEEFFQCEGFKNCAETRDKLTRFLPVEALSVRQLHDDPDVFALRCAFAYEGLDPEVQSELQASTWRFVSSAPTNNPGKFDLWLELKTKDRKVVIGNWKAVE